MESETSLFYFLFFSVLIRKRLQFFFKFVYFRWVRDTGRGRKKERENPKQAPSYQRRARRGAWTHEPWDHDLTWSQTHNRLSHPSAPLICLDTVSSLKKSCWSSLCPELPIKSPLCIYHLRSPLLSACFSLNHSIVNYRSPILSPTKALSTSVSYNQGHSPLIEYESLTHSPYSDVTDYPMSRLPKGIAFTCHGP